MAPILSSTASCREALPKRSGFKVGDRVKNVQGIAANDYGRLMDLPPGKPGDTRAFVVERAGQELPLSLALETQPTRDLAITLVMAVLMWCFVGCGVWAFLKKPAQGTLLFAVAALGIGFGPVPTVESRTLRTMLEFLGILSGFTGVPFLLQFSWCRSGRRRCWRSAGSRRSSRCRR